MKKLFTLIALVSISYAAMAQWLPQASGFSTPSRGIKYLHAVNEDVAWATAYDGSGGGAVIQEYTRTIDGGENWVPGVVTGAEGTEFAMIFGLNADTAYAAMYISPDGAQGIYVTRDGGTTWTRQATALYNNAASFTNVVHFFDDMNGFAQGDPINGEFELYTTADGGENWVAVPGENIADPLSGEWGVVGYYDAVGDTIWFGTNKGRVYRSIDRGLNWEAFATSLTNKYVDVRFVNSMHGLAQDKSANSPGTFSETFDGGETWATIAANGPTLAADFTFVPGMPMTVVATGSNPNLANQLGIAYSYDGGHNWQFFEGTEGTQFLAVDFYSPVVGWAGAFNTDAVTGGMYKYNGDFTPAVDLGIQDFRIYPNPATDLLNIQSEGNMTNVQLINLAGQVVFENNVKSDFTTIQTSQFPKGIYMLAITSDKGVTARKVSIR